jgi:hypothetical protein
MDSARTVSPNRDGRGGSIALLDDEFAGSGGVVCGQQIPASRTQEPLGLAEGLDVRVHVSDIVDGRARQRREAQIDRHDDLARDDELVLEEEVEHLAHRAVDEVLDRHDAQPGVAAGHRFEDLAEATDRHPRPIAQCCDDRILGEGARLARVGDHGPSRAIADGQLMRHRGAMRCCINSCWSRFGQCG